MTTDDVVVDVSQERILACNVRQRFVQGSARNDGSAASRKRRPPANRNARKMQMKWSR